MATYSLHFTQEAVDQIICPETKRDVYVDTEDTNLTLIASYGQSKVFYLRKTIEGQYRKIKLGDSVVMSVQDARERIFEIRALIKNGINPVKKLPGKITNALDSSTEKKENGITFKELFDRYIEEHCKRKNKSWKETVATMDRYGKDFYDMKVVAIKTEDVRKIFNDISTRGKYSANRFFELLRAVFFKAIKWGIIEKSPAVGIELHDEETRERFISTRDEMSRFLKVLRQEASEQMADLFMLSLFTGARKSNVLAMKWQNINFEDNTWRIPAKEAKNAKSQLIHLVEDAVSILRKRQEANKTNSIWVFPSDKSSCGHLKEPKRAWRKICKLAGIDDLRIHDLRRTHGSWMRRAGADRELIGKALGHQDLKSTKIYDIIESDQVKGFREKAMKNIMMSTKDSKAEVSTTILQTEIKNLQADDNTEVLQRKVVELEQQIAALKNKQGL